MQKLVLKIITQIIDKLRQVKLPHSRVFKLKQILEDHNSTSATLSMQPTIGFYNYSNSIRLQPSKILSTLLLLTHGAGLLILMPLMLSLMVKGLFASLIISSLIYYLRQQGLRTAKNAIIMCWQAKEGWWLVERSGQMWLAQLQGNSFSSLYGIILNFKCPEGRWNKFYSLVICPDAINSNDFRRLRVQLQIIRNNLP